MTSAAQLDLLGSIPQRKPAKVSHTVGLRDYQIAAVDAVRKELEEHRGTMVLCATGTGKTSVACELIRNAKGRCLFVAHRDELIQQAANRIEQFTGEWPDIEQAQMKADSVSHRHVVASVQTLSRPKRLERFDPAEFEMIVVDECFVAGTMVGNVPIESITPGDLVLTHTGRLRRVVRLFKKTPSTMMTVHTGKLSVSCTTNHPLLTPNGWVQASSLRCGDVVLCSTHEQENTLREVRGGHWEKEACEPTTLLRQVHQDSQGRKAQDGDSFVRRMRGTCGACRDIRSCCRESGSSVLLRRSQKEIPQQEKLVNYGPHESEICIGEDEAKQPDEATRCSGETTDIGEIARVAERCATMRERTVDYSTKTDCWCFGMGDGDCDTYGGGNGPGSSECVQSRHRGAEPQNSYRSRREEPQPSIKESRGQKEGQCFGVARVDSIEIHEPTSDGMFGGVCPDGFVYNFEVEDDHSYTANGFVVHNCHHGTAKTYRRILDYFDAKVVGLTATPDRSDREALNQIMDSVAYRYDINDAIRDGWLCDVVMKRILVDSMDFSKLKTVAGDFAQDELAKLLETEENLHAIAKPTVELAGDRRTIVFASSVAHAERLAEIIDRYKGHRAAFVVHGKTDKEHRRDMLREFDKGKWQFLVNVQVACEGFDSPGVACISMGRPTKSRSLHTQMIGRGLRGGFNCPVDGKGSDCLVLDFVGNTGRHELITAADVLGGEVSEQELERAKKIIEKSEKPKTLDEAVKEAKEQLDAEQLEAARKRRAGVVGEVKYAVEDYNPYVMFKVKRDFLNERYGMAPATEKQQAAIARMMGKAAKHVPDKLSKHEASRLLGEMAKRREQGLSTVGQITCLARKGLDARGYSFNQASKIIDWVANHNWQTPPASVVGAIVGGRLPGE